MTFIMKKKKYKFSVTLTVEDLSSVPFINSVLFVKCRLLEGGSFEDFTDRREVDDNCVKWNKCFVFTFKTTANTSTGILDSCILRLSIRKETKGGKSYVKLGYYDLNLPSLAGAGHTICRGLLEGYDSRHRQDNSMIQVSVDIKLLAGDPCFKTPKATCLTQKQGSTDVLTDVLNADDSELDMRLLKDTGGGLHNGLNAPSGIVDLGPPGGTVISSNGELSHLHLHQQHHSPSAGHVQSQHHSSGVPLPPYSASSTHNSNGSAFAYHFDPSMTSSATSNTNSVGSAFDPFETGHSRSNSSQTSSSRISTGFNSLPSHSRQGSADSENTGNARHQTSDIKFNSVDRVGNKRSSNEQRTVKLVNGITGEQLASSKKAIDSTRVSADQLVNELLADNKLSEAFEESPFMSDSNGGGLELFVGKDGSATIGSRQSRPAGDSSSPFVAVRTSTTKTTAPSRKLNRV